MVPSVDPFRYRTPRRNAETKAGALTGNISLDGYGNGNGFWKCVSPALRKMGMNSMNQTSSDLVLFFCSFFLQNGLGPDIVPLCLYGDGAYHRSKRFCNGGPIGGFYWTQFAMNFQRRTGFLGPKSWFLGVLGWGDEEAATGTPAICQGIGFFFWEWLMWLMWLMLMVVSADFHCHQWSFLVAKASQMVGRSKKKRHPKVIPQSSPFL